MVGSSGSSVILAAVSFTTVSMTILPMPPSATLAAPPPRAAPSSMIMILQAALVALKLVLGIAKLFLLLLSLVMRIVLTMIGVSVGRR